MRDPEIAIKQDLIRGDDEEEARPCIWQRLSRLMMVLLFLTAMAGVLRLFWPEIQRQKQMNAEAGRLEAIRDQKLAERDQRRNELEWLRTDKEYLEMVARDRLDLAREGESIIRIDRDAAEAPPSGGEGR